MRVRSTVFVVETQSAPYKVWYQKDLKMQAGVDGWCREIYYEGMSWKIRHFWHLGLWIVAVSAISFVMYIVYVSFQPTFRNLTYFNREKIIRERNSFTDEFVSRIEKRDGFRVVSLQDFFDEAPYVEIRGCIPEPFITHVKIGESITFRNTQSEKKTLVLFGKTYSIPAWSKVVVGPEIPAIPALYEFSCNGKRNVGYLYATR